MLHVLIHMDQLDGPVTSEFVGRMLDTNPVVARRTMASLKAAGFLTSEKGHGGGWRLARLLDQITLRDVHEALGGPRVFALGLSNDRPDCLVEQAVNDALSSALAESERLLLQRFSEVTLAALSADFARRFSDVRDGGPRRA